MAGRYYILTVDQGGFIDLKMAISDCHVPAGQRDSKNQHLCPPHFLRFNSPQFSAGSPHCITFSTAQDWTRQEQSVITY
jgi:hypothetical protein